MSSRLLPISRGVAVRPSWYALAEVLEHAEPVPETRTMALIHDDEPEEIGREVRAQLLPVEIFIEVLVVGEEYLPDKMFSARDDVLVEDDAFVSIEGRECPVCLVLEAVPIGQEQNAIAGKGRSRPGASRRAGTR